MQAQHYPSDTGSFALLSVEEKKKRLDAMVQSWQKDTERRLEREGYREFIKAMGLDEYRYLSGCGFPSGSVRLVVGQVITLKRSENGAPEDPALFSIWRNYPIEDVAGLEMHLPKETVFNIVFASRLVAWARAASGQW